MKRVFKSIMMFTAFAVLFSGCEDEITQSELTLNMEKTCSVEIYFEARLDLSASNPWKPVPDGVGVLLSIENSEFNPNATSGRWTYETTTANGKITVNDIPTTDDGVALIIKAEDFIYDQIQTKDNPSVALATVFSSSEASLMVYPNQKHYKFVRYPTAGEEIIDEENDMVSRRFNFRAVFVSGGNLSHLGTQTLRFYNDNWEEIITRNWGGDETVIVPKGQTFTIEFQSNFWQSEDAGWVPYRYYSTRPAYSTDSPFVGIPESVNFDRQPL